MKYYFTFGSGQSPGIGFYVMIEAENFGMAREEMVKRWGIKWSMQYDSADKAGIDRFGLKRVETFDRDTWER